MPSDTTEYFQEISFKEVNFRARLSTLKSPLKVFVSYPSVVSSKVNPLEICNRELLF